MLTASWAAIFYLLMRERDNRELKVLVKELTEVHKQNMKIQLNLMETIERLTNQVIELSEKKFDMPLAICYYRCQ